MSAKLAIPVAASWVVCGPLILLPGQSTEQTKKAPPAPQTRVELDRLRNRMVLEYLEKEGITNQRVLEAMRRVPRHEFVTPEFRRRAYEDAAWPIGHKQTITPPFVVAYMTASLDPRPADRVLEIGTGSGYQAAVLSQLVKQVYSIEILAPLGKSAERRLKHFRYENVKIKIGDGYLGWPEHAPFEKIILTCSPEKVPQPLLDQLKEGGRLIAPLGERYRQEFVLYERKDGKLRSRPLMPTFFVPMTGRTDKERTSEPDPLHPQITNGNFERQDSEGRPLGWYYQRQLTLVDTDVPRGRFCVRFDNEDPGRRAQALQAAGIDGRRIGTLRFQLKIRTDRVIDGHDSFEKAGLQVSFDDFRRFLGDEIALHLTGTSGGWQDAVTIVKVPEEAREFVVRVGLNGATGHLSVDDIRLTYEPRKAKKEP